VKVKQSTWARYFGGGGDYWT